MLNRLVGPCDRGIFDIDTAQTSAPSCHRSQWTAGAFSVGAVSELEQDVPGSPLVDSAEPAFVDAEDAEPSWLVRAVPGLLLGSGWS